MNKSFFISANVKRLFLVALTLFYFSTIFAQKDQQQAEKLDTLVTKLVNQERYADAIDIQKQRLDILKDLYGEGDSTYIEGLGFLGKYYARNQQIDEAIKSLRKATELFETHISTSDYRLSYYLDNLALYLSLSHQSEEAELICRKALGIYMNKGKNDGHMAAILMHLAENCHENKRYQDAIQNELRSLNILKKINGEHSELYINELSYLQKYYESAGQNDMVEKTKERIDKLIREKKAGYEDLPKLIEFKTPEICRMHNDDALRCCIYYLTHRLNAPNIDEATQYILRWSITSADVNIKIGGDITQFLTKQEDTPYLVAYIAAHIYFCLTEDIKQIDEERYIKAINAVLNFYDQNKDLSGNIKVLDDYLKLRKKGKLDSQLLKDYKKYQEAK